MHLFVLDSGAVISSGDSCHLPSRVVGSAVLAKDTGGGAGLSLAGRPRTCALGWRANLRSLPEHVRFTPESRPHADGPLWLLLDPEPPFIRDSSAEICYNVHAV